MAKKRKTSSAQPTARKRRSRVAGESAAGLKRRIERIDREIVALLGERGEVASALANAQTQQGGTDAEIIARAVGRNKGPLTDDCVRSVFRELLSGCQAVQKTLRVAFLGPEFSYSHLAAIESFGQSAVLVPVNTIAAVFEEVEGDNAEFGLVPIENSTDGRVTDTLHRFATSPVRICAEVPLRIQHCLLGIGARNQIASIYSKPQALSQCRNWVAKHLPAAETVEVASTSEAAHLAAQDPKKAAIASEQAGVNNGLNVLARNIEDNPNNVTRFVVIGAQPAERTGTDKTSIMFEVDNQPGALVDALGAFKRNRLNMTWIESFPIPAQRGRYLFFIEFLGHQKDVKVRRAIESLRKRAVRLEILGSYADAASIG